MQEQLNREKEERIRKEREKVDNLIDLLLFHGMNSESDKSEESKQQLLHTEEQVAELLISKRMSYEMVNQCFDRIVEQANRPQSIDSCSPLLSLLLDAACQVDCLERKENPNKRWNGRVERDLRKKVSDRCSLVVCHCQLDFLTDVNCVCILCVVSQYEAFRARLWNQN